MSDVKLKPTKTWLNIDKSSLDLGLPTLTLTIEPEQKPIVKPIQVFKPKPKSNSNELF